MIKNKIKNFIKSNSIVVNLIIIFTLIQPLFDILVYFLRVRFNFDSIIISCVRPLFCLCIYVLILFDKRLYKKQKVFSIVYLAIYSAFCILHIINIFDYIPINRKLVILYESRYLINCGYYILQLININFILKISSEEEQRNFIKSIVLAGFILFFCYFASIISSTSELTYSNSIKSGFRGWSISAHYVGLCCVYLLPIILYSVFEKKHFKSKFKYIFVILPVIAGYYFVGTKTSFFGVNLILIFYTIIYFFSIILHKKKFGFDFTFLVLMSFCLLITFNNTIGYDNFYNQVELLQKDISEDKFTIEEFSKRLDIIDYADGNDDLAESNKIDKAITENVFIKRLNATSHKLKSIDYKIFDNRDVQLKYNKSLRSISPVKDKILGYGYFTMINSLWVETDSLGIFYCFGLLGFTLIIFMPVAYLALLVLSNIRKLNVAKLLFIFALGLSIGVITVSGYTIMFAQTSYYFVLILVFTKLIVGQKEYKGNRKYLFAINDLNVGGAEVGLVDVMNELVKENSVDLVLLRKQGALLEKLDDRINVYAILDARYSKIKQKLYHILYFMGGFATRYVYSKTIEHEYDAEIAYIEGYPAVFIANSTNPNSKKIASIRVGLKKHKMSGEKIPFGGTIIKNAYKRIDEIYTVSNETTKEFLEKYPFCKHKTSTIYTYFNKDFIQSQANVKTDTGFDKKCINYLAVGRFNKQKSYDRLIEAFRKLKSDSSNVKLHILGKSDTPEGEDIINMIKKYNLENDVILHGVISNPYPYMKNCDALVSSSLYEGFPRVINEAMCLKTLCIGTDVTGTREALADERGILVEDSIDGIYKGMLEVLKNKDIKEKYEKKLESFDGNKSEFFSKFKQLCQRKKSLAIFCAKISYGGLEKALVNFINENELNERYNITLYLIYYGKMNYLNLLPQNIKIKVASPNNWGITGKIRAAFSIALARIYLMINKYDISVCYSHHHPILAKHARIASKNSIVFVHSNIYNGTTKKQQSKYRRCHYEKFKKIVCVSNDSKCSVMKMTNRSDILVLNNIIDGESVLKKSLEPINDFKFEEDKIYFANVGRHDEKVKKLVRIINAVEKLNNEFKNFEVIFIGDGPDDDL